MNNRGMPSGTRFAAVDVGSNSIKLRIAARIGSAGSWRWSVLHDEVVITGLGRGLTASPRLDPLAASASLDVLRHFARASAAHGCAGIAAVGTQCLREAEDGAEFAAAVHRDTGLAVEIISGQEEVRLAYLGACGELPPDAVEVPAGGPRRGRS